MTLYRSLPDEDEEEEEEMEKIWQKNGASFYGGGNMLLEGDGFYISYNPFPFSSDNGCDETALCKDGMFFILNGDYRKEYEERIDKGFDACMEFYDTKKDSCKSSWSSDFLEANP